MTDLDTIIAEVKRLDGEATKAPWAVSHAPHLGLKFSVMGGGEVLCTISEWSPNVDRADSELIAYYRNNAPKLAAEVERLRAELAALRARDPERS